MGRFMDEAIKEARAGMRKGDGGPFGAVIVRNGKIVSKAHNMVLATNDPTAHAEVVAIRKAATKLRRFDLSDCEIYATCEPCPMCLGAIHWAKIKRLHYGCTSGDAAGIGFDDKHIYDVINKPSHGLKSSRESAKGCLALFREWKATEGRMMY